MMTRTAAGDGCTATHHAPHGKIRAFYSGLVNEIAGPPASGKSMLGYIEIITYLHRFAGQAVIIDVSPVQEDDAPVSGGGSVPLCLFDLSSRVHDTTR